MIKIIDGELDQITYSFCAKEIKKSSFTVSEARNAIREFKILNRLYFDLLCKGQYEKSTEFEENEEIEELNDIAINNFKVCITATDTKTLTSIIRLRLEKYKDIHINNLQYKFKKKLYLNNKFYVVSKHNMSNILNILEY